MSKLKSFFYGEETPTVKDKQPEPVKEQSKQAFTQPIASAQPSPITYTSNGTDNISDKILKILDDAITAANLPGFDYFEFKNVLSSLDSAPLTEEQKYNTAFATAKAMGVDKDTLLKTIDPYLQALNKREVEFKKALEQQKATTVTAKEQQVIALNDSINNKMKEIERLNKEIQEDRIKQNALSVEISQNNITLQGNEAAFNTIYTSVINKINTDKQNMEKYLK